jgi:hypothetical protein
VLVLLAANDGLRTCCGRTADDSSPSVSNLIDPRRREAGCFCQLLDRDAVVNSFADQLPQFRVRLFEACPATVTLSCRPSDAGKVVHKS